MLIELQLNITICTVVSLAGGGLGKVEQHQGEKSHLRSHRQQTSLG